jgi:phage major head subunit gpT-like protein
MFEQLGWDSKSHPDTLVFSLIIKALNNVDAGSPTSDILGYDGKTFFSTVHPVGLAGATSAVSNCDLSHGGGNLVTNQPWLLVDAGRPVRPFIFQKRKEYTMTRMNALTDEAVFMEKVFRFGVDCRVNAGWGLWQLCYASNADLSDPSAFAEAIAAMRKFKTDAGLPFGSWSSKKKYLVVGPDNEGKARQILNATFAVGLGASNAVATTNIWNGAAELVVTPYLQF